MLKKVLILVILIILVLIGIVAKEILSVTTVTKDKPKVEPIALETKECKLDIGPCTFTHPELGDFQIDIVNRPIRLNIPLKFKLTALNKDVQQYVAWIDFFSHDMNMGYNRPKFKETNIATAVLPTCTRKIMNWQATVLIETDDKYTGAQYKFVTERK